MVAEALLNSSAEVKGVFEKQQKSKYSMFDRLNESGRSDVSVRWDSYKYKVHHKFMVIDNRTVITGSMNPSKNSAYKNDESIIIIEDEDVASEYLSECEGLWEMEAIQ